MQSAPPCLSSSISPYERGSGCYIASAGGGSGTLYCQRTAYPFWIAGLGSEGSAPRPSCQRGNQQASESRRVSRHVINRCGSIEPSQAGWLVSSRLPEWLVCLRARFGARDARVQNEVRAQRTQQERELRALTRSVPPECDRIAHTSGPFSHERRNPGGCNGSCLRRPRRESHGNS